MSDVIRYFCKGFDASGCPNEARYYIWWTTAYSDVPVFCGLCDIKHNAGRGKLKSEIEAPKPMDDRQLVVGLRSDHELIEELRSQLKDAHDLGKRLLFERNSFEGLYKNEQEMRSRAATTFDRALSTALLERDTARAAAADYHKDCISGAEAMAWRARAMDKRCQRACHFCGERCAHSSTDGHDGDRCRCVGHVGLEEKTP